MQDAIQNILRGFQHDGLSYGDYLASRPTASDEAVVRLKIAEPLLAALGYDLQADVAPEHRQDDAAIDLLVAAEGIPVMLWELKRTQETDLLRHEEQLTRYVLAQGVAHAVLCNGREVRVYQRVGDRLRFAYAFSLMAFAPDAPSPVPENDVQALAVFCDAFRKETFVEVERLKQEIVETPTPPLTLAPDQPQNENLLIEDLKREIRRLHRAVLLRFRNHRAQHQVFVAEKTQRKTEVDAARERLWQWLRSFTTRAKTEIDEDALTRYLEPSTDQWLGLEESSFVTEALRQSGIAEHLIGANHINFKARLRDFYRAATAYRNWRAKQLVALRPTRLLMEDFDHWRAEIGVMAEDPAAEFCLQTVYIFVTRLLLIRICEDKDIITQKISDGGYQDYLDFSARFFSNIADAQATLLDLAYKDTSYIYGHFFRRDVFDWYTWEEEAIVRLFWVLNRFDFERVSADLIGRIYEQYVDELERKRKGQFYTPPQVVNYILDQVGYAGPDIVGRRLIDPSCGSGRFLVEAARRLIPELQKLPDLESKDVVNERLRESLFGLDVNRFACFLAEVNLLVQVLGLLKDNPTVARFHIYPTNTLLPREQAAALLVAPDNGMAYESEIAELIKMRGYNPMLGVDFRRGFDYVVGNPPYVRADNPSVKVLRSRVEASGRYATLYKKWDLYIPFIEFAARMLAEGGRHGFIVSDAYQTEEYGARSREMLVEQTTIESLTFAPDVSFFEEAQVQNLIYAVRQGAPPASHQTQRYQAVDAALGPRDLKTLPALSQTAWGAEIFRPAFAGENGLDFSACLPLGEIGYINTGLELQSHEKYDPVFDGTRRKLFVKDDLLSPHPTEIHTKPYVEADDMDRYVVHHVRWLEWGTDRVPDKLRRSRFPQLFDNEKVMIGLSGAAVYDRQGIYYNQANSVSNCVPYHTFQKAEVKHYVARMMAREITDEDIAALNLTPAELEQLSKSDLAEKIIGERAEVSINYDLRYLTALLNCRWLQEYMMDFVRRGSRRRLYPNDLKVWPIAPADAETQAQIAHLAYDIADVRLDVHHWREAGHQIDETGIALNPHPYLEVWNIEATSLRHATHFVTYDIGGHVTTLEREPQRLVFRKRPLSYIESEHASVLDYLARYLDANREALDAVPVKHLAQRIRLPRSADAVRDFMARLDAEREQLMMRWIVAAQAENLLDEWAFDLYGVPESQRALLGGRLYTLDALPDGTMFVSLLDDPDDSPMRRVAFPKDGAWRYRAADPLPNVVRVWLHDGERATIKYGVIGDDGAIRLSDESA
ncbi:MAG: Eco57I restriction-modification methylase domain-containing protein [Anaerolineales bacterium]